MAAADAALAPAALFDLVQRYARDLPDPTATRAWQWLAPWALRRGCASPRIFGRPSLAAQECATALAVEISGDLSHAETHWVDAAELLAASGDADDTLRAALILRHAALTPEHRSRASTIDIGAAELLTRSLQYDPLDCDVHVQLVAFWRCSGKLKRAREQLDLGLTHFPDDVALLTEAVHTALAAGAFKKAATTARRLLELDPLNRKVRSLVGNAHLSHAAKQIAANKLEAARKEIKQAEAWLGATAEQGRMLLLQAWTEPAESSERLRLAQLAVRTWGGGIGAGWRLVRAAHGTFAGLGLKALQRLLAEAGIDPVPVLTAAEVRDLAQQMEREEPVVDQGQGALAPWRKAIEKIAALPAFDPQSTIQICEAFARHHEHGLLEVFANAARKRWPGQPIFVYHAVAARFAKQRRIASERDYEDLEQAQESAHQSNDLRLCMRFEALFEDDYDNSGFDGSELLNPPRAPGVPAVPFDFGTMSPNVFRAAIEQSIKMDGGTSFLKQSRADLGQALFRQIERDCAGNRPLLLRRLTDLVVAEFAASMGQPPPIAAPRIRKPNPPVAGQGDLFDE